MVGYLFTLLPEITAKSDGKVRGKIECFHFSGHSAYSVVHKKMNIHILRKYLLKHVLFVWISGVGPIGLTADKLTFLENFAISLI